MLRLCKHFGEGFIFLEDTLVHFVKDKKGKNREIKVPNYFLMLYLVHLLLHPECRQSFDFDFDTWVEHVLYSLLYKL